MVSLGRRVRRKEREIKRREASAAFNYSITKSARSTGLKFASCTPVRGSEGNVKRNARVTHVVVDGEACKARPRL